MKLTSKIILALILQYMFITVALIFLEFQIIKSKALEVTNIMSTAATGALKQTQMMDEFMSYRGVDYYKLKMPAIDGEFVEVDTIEAIFDYTAQTEDDMLEVYNLLYDNEEFREVSELSETMRVPLLYYDSALSNLAEMGEFPQQQWYHAPLSIMLGLDNQNGEPDIQTVDGGYVSGDITSEIIDMYGFNDVYKKIVTSQGKTVDDSEYTHYFNTPLNLGITYLNRDLLTSLYVNNIDMLMRAQYRNEDIDTGTSCDQESLLQVQTLVCGNTYVDLITGEESLSAVNPVNNGKFTYLRGEEIPSNSAGKAYTGTQKVDIEYKVIDMHSSANESVLRHLFGADTGGGEASGSKSEYLEELNMEKYDLFEEDFTQVYEEYPFIVAKVTFYADFIIPYTTPFVRLLSTEWGTNVYGTFMNLDDSTNVDYGAKRLSHTVLFAVTP